ncbi:hypothetical protein PoB_004990800 [Plakobranchus ocellatus]|uniref:Uncharacterized protein n=1 Tax=Plakobranchus ocellatus TaxID=259542 RepID=A0AAV4BW11_9GAST|nr:hypothetical protein PoB_004990800 [Plakobranchus ocellatus]
MLGRSMVTFQGQTLMSNNRLSGEAETRALQPTKPLVSLTSIACSYPLASALRSTAAETRIFLSGVRVPTLTVCHGLHLRQKRQSQTEMILTLTGCNAHKLKIVSVILHHLCKNEWFCHARVEAAPLPAQKRVEAAPLPAQMTIQRLHAVLMLPQLLM